MLRFRICLFVGGLFVTLACRGFQGLPTGSEQAASDRQAEEAGVHLVAGRAAPVHPHP
jgi:hypothetical protein